MSLPSSESRRPSLEPLDESREPCLRVHEGEHVHVAADHPECEHGAPLLRDHRRKVAGQESSDVFVDRPRPVTRRPNDVNVEPVPHARR